VTGTSRNGETMSQDDASENRARVALLLQDSPGKVVLLLPTGMQEVSAYRVEDLSHAAGLTAPAFIAHLREGGDPLDVARETDPLFRMVRGTYEEALAAAIVEMGSGEYSELCAASSMDDVHPRLLAEQYLDVAPDIAVSVDEYVWSQVRLTREDLIATGMLDSFDDHAANIGLDPAKSDLSRPVVVSAGDGEHAPLAVWDGVHRILSALARGEDSIPAVIGLRRESFDLRLQDRFPEMGKLHERARSTLGPEHDLTRPIWTSRDALDARREGWGVFDRGDSERGRWQIRRVDAPRATGDIQRSTSLRIKTDEAAWAVVMHGNAPRHINAREFVRSSDPDEYVRMAKHIGRALANDGCRQRAQDSAIALSN
jgi:hypothetical protein